MENSGQLSREQAQLQALGAVQALRYEGGNYFWINDMQPVMLMHPIKPALDGQSLASIKDADGKALFVAMVEIVNQQGAGFVDYMWARPGADSAVDKVSFVKGQADWQWIIGSGVYLDDVTDAFLVQAGKLSLIIAVILAGLVYISSTLVRMITEPVQNIQQILQQVESSGDFSLRSKLTQHDEIGQMAQSLNSMLATQQQSIAAVNNVMDAVARGDLEQRVELELTGDLKLLKQRVNLTIEQVGNMLGGLSSVLKNLSHGDFTTQVNTDSQGIYQDIAQAANTGIGAMSVSLAQVNNVIQEMAKGNFAIRIDATMEGEFDQLKRHTNHSLTTLEQAINEIEQVTQAMADNDISQRIEGQYQGQLAQLTQAMNSSLNQLKTMIMQVQQSAIEVTVGTGQLTTASNELSSKAQEQSMTLTQTSERMNELSCSAQDTSNKVSEANTVVIEVKRHLDHGLQVVGDTVLAIDELKESSLNVSRIVEMIDSIAFQTNLLSLNAAVEAARAGDQGLGFAAVANEVKNLSKRSADASKDVQKLIRESLDKTGECIALVHKSDEALRRVSTGMIQVNTIVDNIAHTSGKQVDTIAQVNQGIKNLEHDTITYSTMAEETSSAAANIALQADSLEQFVKRFVIDKTTTGQTVKVERAITSEF